MRLKSRSARSAARPAFSTTAVARSTWASSHPMGISSIELIRLGEQLALNDNYDGRLVLGAGFGANPDSQAIGTYNLSSTGTLHARGLTIGYEGRGTFTQTGGTVIADIGVIVAWGTDDLGQAECRHRQFERRRLSNCRDHGRR